MPPRKGTSSKPKDAKAYRHPDADSPARPEIGAQAHFNQTRPSATYRFDSSLAPALDWDGQNPAREQAEAALREIAEGVSSFKFSVTSQPLAPAEQRRLAKELEIRNYEVELLGLDTFDPVTMEADHLKAADVPAWFLDTDYDGMVFRVRQAFFPRTGAWENLKKSLWAEFEESVWDHLAGTSSAPFPAGDHGQIAVKVIDPRGNELLVVKNLEDV